MLGYKVDTIKHEAWFKRVDGYDECLKEIGCPPDGGSKFPQTIDGHRYIVVARTEEYTSEDPTASVVDKRCKGVIVDTCMFFGVAEDGEMRDLDVDECNQLYNESYIISDGTMETAAVMVD